MKNLITRTNETIKKYAVLIILWMITIYTANAVYLNNELEQAREPSKIELQKWEYDMLREQWTLKEERIKRINLQIEQLHSEKEKTIKEKLQLEPQIQELRFQMTWKK